MFGKKKSGKSTFINKIFKECETNNSYSNSTIGLNLYTIKGTNNFGIIDSPGDTENDDYLKLFSSKGYIYSKMLIYIIDERKPLDSDSLKNNKYLKDIINLRLNYKIPLLILLTHFDNYCDEVKRSEKNWKDICKMNFNENKKNLLRFINELIIKTYNNNFIMKDKDIMHVILVDLLSPNQLSDEELKGRLPENLKKQYEEQSDENIRKIILSSFRSGMGVSENEVKDFFKKLDILYQKELINKIKENIPSQYHESLFQIN